jgi:hypothetical protein
VVKKQTDFDFAAISHQALGLGFLWWVVAPKPHITTEVDKGKGPRV